jgi:hypothetical protein
LGVADGVRWLWRSAPDELRVGSEAALGACLPGEPLEEALAGASPESRRQAAVAEDLGESLTELFDVPRLDEETGDAVLDHLGKPADPARDDGCRGRHRLDGGEAEKLGDRDRTAVARHVNGGECKDLRAAVDGRKVGVRDGAEELDTTLGGERPKQVWIITFGRVWVVPGGADDAQLRMLGERFNQAVDAFVRRQPSDEENAATPSIGIGPKARGIRPSVHDARSRGRHS